MPFQTPLLPSILRLQARWQHRQAVRAAERELRRLEDEYQELHDQWPAPDPQSQMTLIHGLSQNDQAWLKVMARLQHLQSPIT